MPRTRISVNRKAWLQVKKLLDNPEHYQVKVEQTKHGVILIDAGITVEGGLQAGKLITEVCLGGCGEAQILPLQFGDIVLPSIFVSTNQPAISTLGSQLADWQIKENGFSAIGSGPARALARKNGELYDTIDYADEADEAVLVLETDRRPPDKVIGQIAAECKVPMDRLMLILVPTTTVAGATQISGRIVETGMHKLMKLGLDPKLVSHAVGCAPIAPSHADFAEAMGRTNDAILYAGMAYYHVHGCEDDEKLRKLVRKAPSSASQSYGHPFLQVFKEANYDFYRIDPNLFAPASITINNVETGRMFKAGRINMEVFKRSIGLQK